MNRLTTLFINPVLNKEFKLRFRSFKSYLGIFFYLLVLGGASLGFMGILSQVGGIGNIGSEESRYLFIFMSLGQIGLISFMTPGLTAGTISGERERQTLNILLTTQQSSTTIILSKLISSLSYLLVAIFSSLPLYSLVFLYGGVSPISVLASFGVQILTMLTIGSLGVMFSTIIRRTMISVIATYATMLALVIGAALIVLLFGSILLGYNQNPGSGVFWFRYLFLMLNPPVVTISVLEPQFFSQMFYQPGHAAGTSLWIGFVLSYIGITILSLWIAIQKLRPKMKSRG
ncbi:ABC transporter permease [Bacillaceae bacterium S4-13-56]